MAVEEKIYLNLVYFPSDLACCNMLWNKIITHLEGSKFNAFLHFYKKKHKISRITWKQFSLSD